MTDFESLPVRCHMLYYAVKDVECGSSAESQIDNLAYDCLACPHVKKTKDKCKAILKQTENDYTWEGE